MKWTKFEETIIETFLCVEMSDYEYYNRRKFEKKLKLYFLQGLRIFPQNLILCGNERYLILYKIRHKIQIL